MKKGKQQLITVLIACILVLIASTVKGQNCSTDYQSGHVNIASINPVLLISDVLPPDYLVGQEMKISVFGLLSNSMYGRNVFFQLGSDVFTAHLTGTIGGSLPFKVVISVTHDGTVQHVVGTILYGRRPLSFRPRQINGISINDANQLIPFSVSVNGWLTINHVNIQSCY